MNHSYTIILAPNPSIMTGPGTNTIILGGGSDGALVIDPAIDENAYLDTLVQEGEGRGGIGRILITHGHPDHIGGAEALRARLQVPIYAYSRQGVPVADVEIADGTRFPAGEDSLRAIHTPGHRFDQLGGRRFADMLRGNNTPIAHYCNTVRDLEYLVQSMRDVQDRAASFTQATNHREQHGAFLACQRGGRLIEKQYFGTQRPCPGERQSLLLAAR